MKPKVIGTIMTDYGKANIIQSRYNSDPEDIAILLETSDGEAIATLSVNLPDMKEQLEKNQFFAKTWSENTDIAAKCLKSGLFEDTRYRINTGYCEAQIWEIKQFDQIGIPGVKIDWELLRKQKEWLVEQSKTYEEAHGLIQLLDGIQDMAVDMYEIPESIVFGKLGENNDKNN